jgi:FtsH-binding integral membrane protein
MATYQKTEQPEKMKKNYLPLLGLICGILFLSIFFLAPKFPEYDSIALYFANTLLALLSFVSYYIIQNKMKQQRAQAFVNGVYSASLLRLMLCLGGIFIYAYSTREHLHKPTIFAMMGMYLIYTFFETITVSKMVKK